MDHCGALETGCRLGELLALQWADVQLAAHTLLVRAVEEGAKKTGWSRLLPVSARLAAILDMALLDPAGRTYPPSAYVFGVLGDRGEHQESLGDGGAPGARTSSRVDPRRVVVGVPRAPRRD